MNKINGLYVITDRGLSLGRDLIFTVEEAIRGGASVIQLREKNISTGEFVELAKQVREITLATNTVFIVNDRVDVALASDADGVHLGQDDMDIKDARKIMGDEKIIGLSISSYEEFSAAKNLPVDYFGIGPVYPTSSKDDASEPVGVDFIKKIHAETDLPIAAIGGISRENAGDVIRAGASSICVISAVMSAPDIRTAAEEMRRLFL